MEIGNYQSSPGTARDGILFVLSGPSGGGKSTLLRALAGATDFCYSVSCTTRAPRPGEVDGKDYHFLEREDFEARMERGEFLEHAVVHGNRYGTLAATVLEALRSGKDLLMDLDIQGAATIRGSAEPAIRAALVDVFLRPADMGEVRRRLLKRGTEQGEKLQTRLRNAVVEMAAWPDYKYTITSGSPEEDYCNFRAIARAERMLGRRLRIAEEATDLATREDWEVRS
jgi:guanylate kinase